MTLVQEFISYNIITYKILVLFFFDFLDSLVICLACWQVSYPRLGHGRLVQRACLGPVASDESER